MQQKTIFSFDAESAKSAGAGGVSETGFYAGVIFKALYTSGRDSSSAAMEFSIETDVGKANYLRVNYLGREGQELKHGNAIIQAMMGLLKLKSLTAATRRTQEGEELYCPELEGKPIGVVLQKILYTKNTDGSDSYKFDLKQVCSPSTKKTFKEAVENLPAESVDKMLIFLKDKDERTTGGDQGGQYSGGGMMGGSGMNGAGSGMSSGMGSNRSTNVGVGNTGGRPNNLQSAAANRAGHQPQSNEPPMDFDDDIPF
ncbi:hypothetical protein NGK36_17195 [Hafnia alvei]|uniref:hypothetical protein n=1 Tax=Hafnia alvei TaxID=569 RepID=UPI002DB70A75|nr:hypothetical protein [Hafnia alvei]MEB7891008.1 hypothetical protein [Hafnia alvei]